MEIDATTRELIESCLVNASNGDGLSIFNLASVLMNYADAKDIELNLAVVEVLARLASMRGCNEAQIFLAEQWPSMKDILRKRWLRNGMQPQ